MAMVLLYNTMKERRVYLIKDADSIEYSYWGQNFYPPHIPFKNSLMDERVG